MNTAILYRVLTCGVIVLLGSVSGQAQLQGTGWLGDGANNNWSVPGNWDTGVPGGNIRDLYFGSAWAGSVGGANFTTANNDLSSYEGHRITFENNASTPQFTITGNGLTLFDYGNQFPRINNSSSADQTIALSGTLKLSAGSTSVAQINPLNGNLSLSGASLSSGAALIELQGNTKLEIFGNADKEVFFGGAITGTSTNNTVTIFENTRVTFAGANTYAGDTFINAGALRFAEGGSLGNGTIWLGPNNGSAPATLSIIDANGGTTISTPIVVRPGSGLKTISATHTSGVNTFSGNLFLDADTTVAAMNSNATLALSGSQIDLKSQTLTVSGAGTTEITGVLQNSNGSGKLTMSGTGTLTLTGSNTFSGATTVNGGGTLVANTASGGALANTGSVILNSGSLLLGASNQINNSAGVTLGGGTLDLNGQSEGGTSAAGVGVLTLTAGSFIDFGASSEGNSSVRFSGISQSSPGAKLQITNWAGDALGGGAERLLFSGSPSEFTGLFDQSEVSFNGVDGYQTVAYTGYYEVAGLTPVPEPSTIFTGLALLGLAGWRERKRFSALMRRN